MVNSYPLLIEAGNSTWQAARYTDALGLKEIARGQHLSELSQWLTQQPQQHFLFASVGNEAELLVFIEQWQQQGYQITRVQTGQIAGFNHCYKEPQRLGVDRWLTMVALRFRPQPVVIIDLGTAMTLDLLAVNGQHLGGWIAPGFHLMQEALVQRSHRLSKQNNEAISNTSLALGTQTETAIRFGCQAALQGFCEQAVLLAQQELGSNEFELYFSGGGVQQVNLARFPKAQVRPLLVLEGLCAWWQNQ